MPIPCWMLWLLPMLFVVHDLEEVLFLPSWLRRNRDHFERRFPALARRLLPHLESVSGKMFAAMAAEELLLIVAATVYSAVTGNYYPWLALLLAFGIHLLVHLGQCLAVRGYVPSAATSLVGLPVCIYVVWSLAGVRLFSAYEFVLCALAGSVVAAVNLWLIHRVSGTLARKPLT